MTTTWKFGRDRLRRYGVVFSSHSLEHFFDPLEALLEWDRVIAPGGCLLLVLPHGRDCTDRHRQPATMQELLAIRARPARTAKRDVAAWWNRGFVAVASSRRRLGVVAASLRRRRGVVVAPSR